MGEARTETPLRLTFFRELSDERILALTRASGDRAQAHFSPAFLALCQHMPHNARVADAQLSMCGGRCSDAVVYFELLV
jgi:phosphoenolpyruvate-protein kinase (PTS system EI component)